MFDKSKWIWADCEICNDQYTEYIETIGSMPGKTILNISCDTDYTLFINGRYVASNQYGDFEHYKIYDTIDVTEYLIEQSNVAKIIVFYCGVDTQRYKKGAAGLIYEFINGDKCIAYSDTKTLSRVSRAYISGQQRFITTQLGFSFTYDSTKEDEFGYQPSIVVDKKATFFKRPIEKLQVLPRRKMVEIKKEAWGYLIDLGSEVVGLPTLDLISSCDQMITVNYGESLDDGRVRSKIQNRNFYYQFKAKKGNNQFTNYMLRLSCRYLEVVCDNPIEINYVGILPQVYKTEEVPCEIDSVLDRKIYDICLNTLHLCMMEHYVDTPWREQCLYAFDAKNQMLCGYYCFKNKNSEYARSNLVLISEDRRDNGLLSICSPCGTELTIPSFSLYYILAMGEYAGFTKDYSLAKTYVWKMESVLDEFLKHMEEEGLIRKIAGKGNWNFYDWSQYLSNGGCNGDESKPDLVINCLFVMAMDSFEEMCKKICAPFKYSSVADAMRLKIKQTFATDNALLSHHKNSDEFTALGNALAVLCGAVKGKEAVEICDSIVQGKTAPSSLSMNIFKYEAMLLTDVERYREYILSEIRNNYKRMLDAGSTTVWETENGSVDFSNAGSLCHGWSAVPIYIFHRLGIVKPKK